MPGMPRREQFAPDVESLVANPETNPARTMASESSTTRWSIPPAPNPSSASSKVTGDGLPLVHQCRHPYAVGVEQPRRHHPAATGGRR